MNVAYGWAFFNPVRKVYLQNLAITGLSVFICFFIGTIEILGLLPQELNSLNRRLLGLTWPTSTSTPPASSSSGCSSLTWVGALMIWKYGHVEEKWSAKLTHQTSPDPVRSGPRPAVRG